jgi:8-oxo-dGTP pyrophosphatase MutT (NUDIX family)
MLVQAGAVPYRVDSAGIIRVCLITNREGGWIVPKGKIDPGHSARQAAVIECYEEAGVRGTLHREPLGAYSYLKPQRPGPGGEFAAPRRCKVRLFALRVSQELNKWPERGERTRQWMPISMATRRAAFADLAHAIAALRRLVRALDGGASPPQRRLTA